MSDHSSPLSWDEYFMLQALIASYRSKDPNTKVGCVFVDDNNHQLSMGYNGHIAQVPENNFSWESNKSLPLDQQKYSYVVHSEANAILHAKAPLQGSKVYVTLFPCHECSKMIATVKVKEVIYLSDKYENTPENLIAKKIFNAAGIKYRQFLPNKKIISGLNDYLLKAVSL